MAVDKLPPYRISNNDWSICIFPQMTLAYSERCRMTVRAISKEGFAAGNKPEESIDKDRSPFEKVEIRIDGTLKPLNTNPTFRIEVEFEKI